MFKWEKLGKVFDPADLRGESWMREFAQSPSVAIFPEFVRIYFCSRPDPDSAGMYRSYIAYVDVDRKDPTRVIGVCDSPVLELGRVGTFDEFGTNPVSVIQAGNEIRAYYAGWTRCESVPFNAAIGMAVSKNGGKTFSRIGEGPVLSYSFDEPFLLGSPRVRMFNGRWYIWYVAGKRWIMDSSKPEPVYKLRMASSDDGVSWEKRNVDILEDKLGADECQACGDVTYFGGSYHMFYSYRESQNYKDGKGGYRIGYASSLDLLNWKRDDGSAGLCVSEKGWDSQMVSYPHVFNLDDQIYMLYQGNGMGRSGFGLAKLK